MQSGPASHASVVVDKTTITGFISEQGVSTFLGVPYATVPARFRTAVPLDVHQLGNNYAATDFGPQCLQPIDALADARAYLWEGLRPMSSAADSDFECLRINIWSPPDAHLQQSKLPVFVWIHGGGFAVGNGNTHHDGNFMVKHAMDSGKPFIYATLNYRLGLFGFLSSEELRAEAAELGEVHYANNGHYDQRLALLWVQRHIAYFGGDSNNITIAGESAGAVSVLAHMRGDVHVCDKAIVMSAPSWPMQTLQDAQQRFDHLVESTGLSTLASPAKKLSTLRALTDAQLIERLGPPYLSPTHDPAWFDSGDVRSLEEMQRIAPGLKKVIVGATKHEMALWATDWLKWTTDELQQMIRTVLPDPGYAEEVISMYGISGSPKAALRGIIDFGGDSLFIGVPLRIGNETRVAVSVYRFDQEEEHPNSPFRGYAYHALDSAYWTRYPCVAGAKASACSYATCNMLSQVIMDLVYRQQTWPEYCNAHEIMVFGGITPGLTQMPRLDILNLLNCTLQRKKLFRDAGHRMISYSPSKK